jgi:hypothetical protein
MTYDGKRPELDMTPDGRFRGPPTTPLATRIARTALVIAILSGVMAVLILALWFALALIPVAIGAALIAWAAFRFRLWQMRRASRGRRDLLRT